MAIDAAHAEFVRDCWRYLQASAPRWARYSRQWPEFTALECELVMEAAYTRLARARRDSDKKDDAAEIIFHVPLRDVSDATWRAFVRRVSMRPTSSSTEEEEDAEAPNVDGLQ